MSNPINQNKKIKIITILNTHQILDISPLKMMTHLWGYIMGSKPVLLSAALYYYNAIFPVYEETSLKPSRISVLLNPGNGDESGGSYFDGDDGHSTERT